MGESVTSRRGVRWPAVNPKDGKPCEVLISQRRIRWLRQNGIRAIREAEYIVSRILTNPTMIYEGLRRDDDEDRTSNSDGWICYCAAPKFGFDDLGHEMEVRGEVMMVFVNKEFTAYNWRWEDENPDRPGTPLDHKDRFTREVM